MALPKTGWSMRLWVQDPLDACVTYELNKRFFFFFEKRKVESAAI
jgi:hypothetical protein